MKKPNAWHIVLVLTFTLAVSTQMAFAITETQANSRCAAGETGPFEVEVSGGQVTCACDGSKCNAQTFTDAAGNSQGIGEAINFMQQALGMLQGLLGKGGGSGGGGGGSAAPSGGNYLPTTAPSAASFFGDTKTATSSDAYFDSYYKPAEQAPKALQDAAAEPSATFLDAVSKGFSNVADKITEVTVGIADKPIPPPPVITGGVQKGIPPPPPPPKKDETPIEIGVEEDSTGVAGFYGAANEDGPGLSMVGRLCVARPWAGGIFAKIIPAVLFDKLCNVGGYHVGALPTERDVVNATQLVHQAAQRSSLEEEPVAKKKGISCKPAVLRQGAQAIIEFSCGAGDRLLRTVGFRAGINDSRVSVRPQKNTIYGIVCSNDFEESCQVKVVNPRITLVAEPSAVRLGTRAIIRWETKDVEGETCVVKGPSFSETGSYGAASTVPISGPSTYTATCTAVDGEPVTENLTLELAL